MLAQQTKAEPLRETGGGEWRGPSECAVLGQETEGGGGMESVWWAERVTQSRAHARSWD